MKRLLSLITAIVLCFPLLTSAALGTSAQGCWAFDETAAGTSAADATVNANTLVNRNNATFVNPIVAGHATNLAAASTQGFSIADASQTGLENAGNFSVSIWMNPTTLSDNQLMGKYGTSGQRAWRLEQNTDAGSTFYFTVTSDGSTAAQVSWVGGLVVNKKVHVVLTWAAATSKANLYINHVIQAEKTTGGVTALFNGTSAFSVGMDSVTGNYSNAAYDAAAFYTRVLTQADVDALWNGGAGIDCAQILNGIPSHANVFLNNTDVFINNASVNIF